jgi:hypothetical protein
MIDAQRFVLLLEPYGVYDREKEELFPLNYIKPHVAANCVLNLNRNGRGNTVMDDSWKHRPDLAFRAGIEATKQANNWQQLIDKHTKPPRQRRSRRAR